MADTMDNIHFKDQEIDIKDELEPLLADSSAAMKTDFKDEFSDEVDAEALEDPVEDQDTESDEVNDVEEVGGLGDRGHDESVSHELVMTDVSHEEVGEEEMEPVTDPLDYDLPVEVGDDVTEEVGDDVTEEVGEDVNGTEQEIEEVEDVIDDEPIEDVGAEEGDEGEGTVEASTTELEEPDQSIDMDSDGNQLEPQPTASARRKQQTGTKRKVSETEVTVRKSSRIKHLVETRKEKEETVLQGKSVHDTQREKTKMLQRPTERPTRLNEDDEISESEKTSDTEKEEEIVEECIQGDRTRPPGADAPRKIDQDFLLPFRLGWTREVVIRPVKTGPAQVDIFYWPPKNGEDHGSRNREARRKRRSKVDQERYFEEFSHPLLSVNNFTYVRRPLDLNNEAYEIVRSSKPSLETRSDKRTRAGKVASYKEVAEHEGLLSSNSSEDEGDEIEEITEFDQGLPLSLQVLRRTTPLREESKKRRKYPDRERCLTPCLAEDIPWTYLDDDPLGIYTELGGRSSPATPPPLRAVRLTSHPTIENIKSKLDTIRSDLADPLVRITEGNKDLLLKENLASHDTAIRKYKNFNPAPAFPHRMMQGRPVPRGIQGRSPVTPQQRQFPSNNSLGYVKVRLPMISTNGKRPVVELVMLTNGKYQPIKFTNNRQVTESIPKRLFDQANGMRKTLYQRSVQVPKIGAKQVFIAINPSPGGFRPFNGGAPSPAVQKPLAATVLQTQKPAVAKPSPVSSEQVSILVRPAQGGNAVLLNVPKHVAVKVKIGTTLSFSASNEQKYTVIDNKMHPPVGKSRPMGGPRPQATQPMRPSGRPMPNLPAGVSIRPIQRPLQNRLPIGRPLQARPAFGGRQMQGQIRHMPNQIRPQQNPARKSMDHNLSSFSPCSPFCPGVSGIPELECSSCHSLFHPKCVGIPPNRIAQIRGAFRCKSCGTRAGSGPIQVIDLD